MNWSDILAGAVVGAALGAVLNEIAPNALQALRRRSTSLAAVRRRALFESGAVRDWLIAYYATRGRADDLYDCRFGRYESKIPFLTCDEWSAAVTGIDPNKIVTWSSGDPASFPIDTKLVREMVT
jgi:hypothetical protein